MPTPLRVGVLGLGRRWQRRFVPALRALPQLFVLQAVCDQVHERALHEAQQLGCAAESGPTALLERDDVEVLLLLERQWYGGWPLELASQRRKPVFCRFPLEEETHTEEVLRQFHASGTPLLIDWLPHVAPGPQLLEQLLQERLGLPRVLLGEVRVRAAPHRWYTTDSWAHGTLALVDWCLSLLGGEPHGVLATSAPGLTTLQLDWPEGRSAHLQQFRAVAAGPRLRLQVLAEQGTASVELPARLDWEVPDGQHAQTSVQKSPNEVVWLQRFYSLVREGIPVSPGLTEVERLWKVLRAAERSRVEGRRVELASPEPA